MEHEIIQFSGIFSALFLGIILGLSHSTDGDHVVAVSTMARDYKNIMKSIWVGISWGLGHSTPLLILGILILIIKESLMSFYEKIAVYFEFGVAIMLIFLGIQVFWKLRQGIFHTHSHDHDKNKHTHMHASHSHNDNQESEHYENEPHPLLTMFPFFRPKSFIIGLIHGMAGSAAVMLAILPTTPSLFTGLLFLLFFSFGTMMAMAMMTLVLAVPFKYTNSNKFGNYVVAVFGTLSILLGIALASDISLGTSYTDVLWY